MTGSITKSTLVDMLNTKTDSALIERERRNLERIKNKQVV